MQFLGGVLGHGVGGKQKEAGEVARQEHRPR